MELKHPPSAFIVVSMTRISNNNPNNNNKKKKQNNNNKQLDYQKYCFNVDDFQRLSKQILPKALYEYLASGSDNEQTLQWNRRAYHDWWFCVLAS
mmetsp:Transcript_30131/g.44521  ORF Transcript_30131/g.44521 Transcript_30131/m.44521 type:complete len:95 (+) Transcript_30131:117-401(+)